MRLTGVGQCISCGIARPLSLLLRVTSLIRPDRSHFVCRPGTEGNDPNCFRRGTCWVGHHSIAPAMQAEPERPAVHRPKGLPAHLREYVAAAA